MMQKWIAVLCLLLFTGLVSAQSGESDNTFSIQLLRDSGFLALNVQSADGEPVNLRNLVISTPDRDYPLSNFFNAGESTSGISLGDLLTVPVPVCILLYSPNDVTDIPGECLNQPRNAVNQITPGEAFWMHPDIADLQNNLYVYRQDVDDREDFFCGGQTRRCNLFRYERASSMVSVNADRRIDATYVLYRDMLQFVNSADYNNPSLWHPSAPPVSWRNQRAETLRQHHDENAPDAIVTTASWYEADAYCRYRNARLPQFDDYQQLYASQELHRIIDSGQSKEWLQTYDEQAAAGSEDFSVFYVEYETESSVENNNLQIRVQALESTQQSVLFPNFDKAFRCLEIVSDRNR